VPWVDPLQAFDGTVVIAAPHMDDEVLACGGTIARLPDKEQIHCVYATDGSKSPVPILRWLGSTVSDLVDIRMREAKRAMAILGVPEKNLHFLQFPDGRLHQYMPELIESLGDLLRRLHPRRVLMPFRYDRHPDHLALNRGVMGAAKGLSTRLELFEYFVYYRWFLLPRNDVRKFIRPEQLLMVDIRMHAGQKRQALECYESQTTLFSPWQDRPIIPEQRLSEVSRSPEWFLRYDPLFPLSKVFTQAAPWIRLVHWLEPVLKEQKERLRALTRLRLRLNPKRRSMFEVRCSNLRKANGSE
jgi:LmbE family N-acetylglucosaminyl deacetylase